MMEEEKLATKELYDLSHTAAAPLLAGTTYPWEALPKIGGFIRELGATLSLEEYGHPQEDVWIHKTAKVYPNNFISGPCIIGPEAEVRPGAFIRGNALVGAHCVVGNSTELKNAILFDNVQVPHYNYVGDSILGYKSHMGAGAVTSNVKQDKSPVAVKIGFRSLETGLKKFGAMLGRPGGSGMQQRAEPRHRGGERLPCVPAFHDAWVPAQRHDPQKHGGNCPAARVGLNSLGMTLWERGKSLGIHCGISAIGRVAHRAADCADLGAAAGAVRGVAVLHLF